MTRGSSSRSGPAPSPTSLRGGEWTTLPAAGRAGDPPPWPLSRPSAREKALWASEWKRPQAVMWERNEQALAVALYVRAVIVAEGPLAKANDRVIVLRLMEDLGVSLSGLHRNRWVIEGSEDAAAAQSNPKSRPRSTARDRLSLVVNQ